MKSFLPRSGMYIVFVAVGLVYFSTGLLGQATEPFDSKSLLVSMTVFGSFAQGKGWKLLIDETGNCRLTFQSLESVKEEFVISKFEVRLLRSLLQEQRFDELPEVLGEAGPDGSRISIEVSSGVYHKLSVRRDFGSINEATARHIRLSLYIRSLFHDDRAVDLRRYDRKDLDEFEHSRK